MATPALTHFFQPSRRVAAVAPLGNVVTDFITSVTTSATDVLDTFTGKRAERQAQEKVTKVALAQQQANIQMQAVRAAGWKTATPWLVAGVTALGLGVLWAVVKRRGG